MSKGIRARWRVSAVRIERVDICGDYIAGVVVIKTVDGAEEVVMAWSFDVSSTGEYKLDTFYGEGDGEHIAKALRLTIRNKVADAIDRIGE